MEYSLFCIICQFGKELPERVGESCETWKQTKLKTNKQKKTLFNQVIKNKFLFKITSWWKEVERCNVTHTLKISDCKNWIHKNQRVDPPTQKTNN